MAKRDPEGTRRRILAAALKEFAARGFAGARVERIARRARVNKRMLYHYFGNKRELYAEVFRRKLQEKAETTLSNPEDPADALPLWYDDISRDLDWVRLLTWEALGHRIGRVGAGERRIYEAGIRWAKEAQAAGFLHPEVDPEFAFIAFVGVNMFPVAFPQLVEAMTGLTPTDPEFRERQKRFGRLLGELLHPQPEAGPAGL